MWDSRASSFSKTGKTRWSYETYSTKDRAQDAFGRARPLTMQESPSFHECANVQRSDYRQPRSSWQRDNRSWYNVDFLFSLYLLLPRTIAISTACSLLFVPKRCRSIKIARMLRRSSLFSSSLVQLALSPCLLNTKIIGRFSANLGDLGGNQVENSEQIGADVD